MVVTFVANTGAIGGAEMYLINLANGLRDCECRVLMPRGVASTTLKSRALRARVDELPTDGYSVHPRALAKSIAFFSGLRTDILHFNLANPSASTVDILAARLCCRAPIIVTSHTPYAARTGRERATARMALSLASQAIVVCEESRCHVLASGAKPRKVTTIHNGVTDYVPPAGRVSGIRQGLGMGDSGSILFGTVARLEEEKGLNCLLSAFGSVVAGSPRARLCIVGDGSLGAELRALATDLDIAAYVTFVPWSASYLDYVAAFDVFVLPSLFESFPFAVVEAMMAGMPVVATDVGGVGEAVLAGKSGLLVPPNDADALARALTRLIASEDQRHEMGAVGRRRALAMFSADVMVGKTRALYGTMCKDAERF